MAYDLKSVSLIAERGRGRSPRRLLAQDAVVAGAGAGTARTGVWATALRAISATRTLSLTDQAVVSGTSFLTTVAIGRFALPSELGAYALALSVLIGLLNVQHSLISLPYTIQRHHPLGTAAEDAGSSLALSGLLSIVATVIVAVIALSVSTLGTAPDLVTMAWALAAAVPFVLLRGFGREFAFAHLHVAKVLILDVGVAATQLGALGWLAWTGRLTATTALAATAAACGLAGALWFYLARTTFVMRADQLPKTMQRSWDFGKWLFANLLTLTMQGQISYWLVAGIAGTTATGIYAACMSIVSFANPLILGLGNTMLAQAALAFKEGGSARLRHGAIQDALLLGGAMTLFGAAILVAGEDVVRLLFHNPDYAGHGSTIMVLALWQLSHAVGMPASNALSTMQYLRTNFYIGLAATALTIILVWSLTTEWGLLGAAYGLLMGGVARSAGRWVAFLALAHQDVRSTAAASNLASVTRVLQNLTQSQDDGRWAITQLDVGGQGHIFVVHSKDRLPIWRTHHSLVIKLYMPEAALNVAMARSQCQALSLLHAGLNGRTVNGWKIAVPEPLYVSETPLASVMTVVPGRALNVCLERGDHLTPDVLESVARAVAAAMEKCWSKGQLHGDLALHNILCDVQKGELSFVDAGVRTNWHSSDDLTKRCHPATQDLAQVLCDVGATVKRTIANPCARMREQVFTESLVRAFLGTIGSLEEKKRLLDELHDCARLQINTIELPMSPRGLWRALRKQIAFRRIAAIVSRLRAELNPCRSGLRHLVDPRSSARKTTEGRAIATRSTYMEIDCGVTRMPRPNLLARIFFRIVRDIKSIFGVDSYLKNEDRRVLERVIFPYFLHEDTYKDILFVGCDWYTKGYNEWFEQNKHYWTIEIDPSKKKYGAKRHIVDGLQHLSKHFRPSALDLIMCNGVFGWGLDAKIDVEQAFRACCDCLREGGVLVVGWDDIDERRPFPVEECQSLHALKPFVFPPLGTAEYMTDTPYRHTFRFYVKQ